MFFGMLCQEMIYQKTRFYTIHLLHVAAIYTNKWIITFNPSTMGWSIPALNVTLNVLRLVIWIDIKQINSNVTTATLNPLRQVIWGDTRRKVKLNVTSMALKSTQEVIWRNAWVKVQVNVTNVTLNDLQQVKWFDIRKVKLNVTNVTNIFYTPYEGRDVAFGLPCCVRKAKPFYFNFSVSHFH